MSHRRGRQVLFTALYASEGAPIGFIWFALPTLLRESGLPIKTITAITAMLTLPWVGKFLWAPLVDVCRSPRFGVRGWIVGSQLLMGVTLLPLTVLSPGEHLLSWQLLLLAHAFSAATQDVAVDTLAVRSVAAEERGSINGCMQAGMLIGRSVFAGGTLWVWHHWGQAAAFLILIGFTWSSLILVLLSRPPAMMESTGGQSDGLGAARRFARRLGQAFRHRSTWWGLLFALTSAAAFELAGGLAGPYLVDRQFSETMVSTFLTVVPVVPALVGSICGGWLADRWRRAQAVGCSVAGFSFTILLLAGWETFLNPPPFWGAVIMYCVMYFFVGLFIASSYALFMDLTDPRLGATQFSTFMAATNGCESWSVGVGGQVVERTGYAAGWTMMALVSLASLGILRMLSRGRTNGAGIDIGNPTK